ncbi:MAG: hypothetical protein EZS28_029692 [Streblomastix strix]|uniref:Uncharacterized protein n=1 Tax=Streblomastix strix TaxID=222440 RepID=A0A5J4UWG3_9EUKA|nr:MAG: hypothetical protein EZS28_029692 [Streblomastix strix]
MSRLKLFHRTGKRESPIPYAWLEQRNSGTRNIDNQEEFETPSRQDMLFPDCLKARKGRRFLKVPAQFISVNTSTSSALQFLNRLSSILSITFDIDLKNNHMLQFTRKAISAHMIVKPKYEETQYVGILFDYWKGKGSNRNLTNVELQTKLVSLHMIICSM